ncbi:MAG: hypothetical protein HOW73_12830 [Polyangiaceae bacterium]|nr:hypothetical protein [Polyangiaceae bacterium]
MADEHAQRDDGTPGAARLSLLDRVLRVFADVRAGEGVTAALLSFGLFLLLASYYVIKPIRDSLITGLPKGAEYKSWMGAAIAIALLGAVPAYAKFASSVPRNKLLLWVTAFFVSNLVGFYLLGVLPFTGSGVGQLLYVLGFFLWVGVFNMMVIAQYWAFANDIYTEEQGKRLFPLIGIGASIGSAVGSMVLDTSIKQLKKSAEQEGRSGTAVIAPLLLLAAVILAASAVIALWVHSRESRGGRAKPEEAKQDAPKEAESKEGAFRLVLSHRYLLLIALFSLVFTLVNTNSEFVKDVLVKAYAAELGGGDEAKTATIRTELFNQFYLWVNLLGAFLQSFVVSRIVKFFGLRRAFFMLPFIALLDATTIALLPVWGIVRFGKIAENATDYSLNNTLRNMLWLPTTRRMKYVAKQAVDTFFVRAGDVGSAALVFLFSDRLKLGVRAFAITNIALIGVWLVLARLIVVENDRMTKQGAIKQKTVT